MRLIFPGTAHHRLKTLKYYLNTFFLFPATDLERPLGLQKVEAPEVLDNRHMKVVRMSVLRTGRLYPCLYCTTAYPFKYIRYYNFQRYILKIEMNVQGSESIRGEVHVCTSIYQSVRPSVRMEQICFHWTVYNT